MRTILLIMIGLSSFSIGEETGQFTKVANIVSDSKTGLQWQDNNETNSTTYNWQEAIDYCEALSLDSYDDWRLPNINELKTLLDRSKRDPAIVDGFEYVVSSSYYWSSTSIVDYEDGAWFVPFGNGYVDGYGKNYDGYVRCVRDGQ